MNVAWPLRIYYDRACPLCSREMQALADNDPQQRLQLVDCSGTDFSDACLQEAGISPAEAMDFIHARDAQGRWLKGMEVFEAAYAAVGLERVAAVWAHPLLRPIWDRLYPWVAGHRMGLSRLGLDRPFGWLVTRAARRAAARSRRCRDGNCTAAPHV